MGKDALDAVETWLEGWEVDSVMEDELRARARRAANRIADEHRGAWGGVMLQVDWMTDVIAEAMRDNGHEPWIEEQCEAARRGHP